MLSRVLERIVVKRLESHLNENKLILVYQSGFRADFIFSTALTSVITIIIKSIDHGMVDLLALFDYRKLLTQLVVSYLYKNSIIADVVNWWSPGLEIIWLTILRW